MTAKTITKLKAKQQKFPLQQETLNGRNLSLVAPTATENGIISRSSSIIFLLSSQTDTYGSRHAKCPPFFLKPLPRLTKIHQTHSSQSLHRGVIAPDIRPLFDFWSLEVAWMSYICTAARLLLRFTRRFEAKAAFD